MSKGTKMVNSGSRRGTVKALNSRAEIEEEGDRWVLATSECGERKEKEECSETLLRFGFG